MKISFEFYTQYNQFYIKDSCDNGFATDTIWTDEAFNDRLGITPNLIAITTASYGTIRGEVWVLDAENSKIDFDNYDHIVEGSLQIKSQKLQFVDCPNSQVSLEIPIDNGRYRVRICSSNLNSVIGDDGDDYYKIEIWKAKDSPRKVLKRYLFD